MERFPSFPKSMRNPAPHPDKKGRSSLSGLRSFHLSLAWLPVQRAFDRFQGVSLLAVVVMGIDLLRGGQIRVAEPLLDVLHRDALVAEERRAAVPEVMEADLPEPMVSSSPLTMKVFPQSHRQ
jgi:hypothetical protein